jgi:hypothetical protein
MDKIKLLKNLIRLSQMAEELENDNPEVSQKLTDVIGDAADEIAPDTDVTTVDTKLFPPIENPVMEESDFSEPEDMSGDMPEQDIDEQASEIAAEIVNSPEFQDVIETITNENEGDDQQAVMDLAQILKAALED